jgi:hypothetical protein
VDEFLLASRLCTCLEVSARYPGGIFGSHFDELLGIL